MLVIIDASQCSDTLAGLVMFHQTLIPGRAEDGRQPPGGTTGLCDVDKLLTFA